MSKTLRQTSGRLSHVTVTRFYISRYLITNAEYEQFDRCHACKRAPGAGDRHPVDVRQ